MAWNKYYSTKIIKWVNCGPKPVVKYKIYVIQTAKIVLSKLITKIVALYENNKLH